MPSLKEKTSSLPVAQVIQELLELQEIHQNLDALEEDIFKLRGEAEEEERKHRVVKEQYEKNLPFVEKAQKEYAQLKTELEEIKGKIAELEESKKKIKTIKEFKTINKDIDILNKKNAIRENDLLTKGEELEFKKSRLEKVQEKIAETQAVIDQKKEDLDNLIRERKDDIAKFTRDKEKVVTKLPEGVVTAFDRIYRNKVRTAVVAIEGQVCQGCYMKVPMQVEINVKKGDQLIYCPSCSRILYRPVEAEQKSA